MSLNPSQTAFIFPGQGSQQLGMGLDLARDFQVAKDTFLQANDVLGAELTKILWEGPAELLNDTINTQPGLLTHSIAALRVFCEINPEFQPAYVTGHSMGQFSGLVAAGALTFEDALQLVHKRGQLMKTVGESSPGGMAALIGMDLDEVEEICSEASIGSEVVQVANDNCPGQIVISGSKGALDRAIAFSWDADPVNVVPLDVSVAGHSPLMKPMETEFFNHIQATQISAPEIPVIGNVTARPLNSAEAVRDELKNQLTSRVRWAESIRYLISQGINTFVEFGSGNALRGMLRRFDPDLVGISLGTVIAFSNFSIQI